MASLTIEQRLARLKTYLNQYLPLQKIPDQFLIKKIERARDYVFRGVIMERDYLFRTFTTVADGDNYPADWISYANNAYYMVSGNKVPFTFINIGEIGASTNNKYALGTTTTPKIFFCDKKVHTEPPGLTAITIEYVKRPAALDGQPLSTTDIMPEDTEDMILRASFERILSQLQNDKNMLELSGLLLQDVQTASQKYYLDFYQKNIVAGGGVELTD